MKTSVCGTILVILLAGTTRLQGASTIQWSASSYGVNEAAGRVTLTVQRQGDLNVPASVDFATANGTALAGLDYEAAAKPLTFDPDQTQRTLVVQLLNDNVPDGTRSFRVLLSNPAGGAVLGSRTNATVSIEDNDVGIQFRFASRHVAEDAGAVEIGVVRVDDGEVPMTVDVATSDLTATSGVDYTGVTNKTVWFGPTDRLKFVTVPILNDGLKESDKTFRLTLSNPTGGTLANTKTTTVTITDNDQGFAFESATYKVAEDGGAVLVGVLRGTDHTNCLVTVDCAASDVTTTHGLDYLATSQTVSFAPGEMVKVVPIPILNDGAKEGSESFRVTLSHPGDGAALGIRTSATVTIVDNDPGAGFEADSQSVWEGAGAVTITVVRGQDGDLRPFAVDYATSDGTAKAGEDYEGLTGTLTFQENETVKSLSIPIRRDGVAEGTERFYITLSNPTGGASVGRVSTTVVIEDDRCTVVPPFDAKLTARRERGVNLLTWTGGGHLQKADRVTGPWQKLPDAKSPWAVAPPLPMTFYRVVPPRPVTLYIPPSYDERTGMPLVISLHGTSVNGEQMESILPIRPLAVSRGFLYCCPDATQVPGTSGTGLAWFAYDEADDCQAELGFPYIDDVAYLQGLIEETGRHFALDPKQVYLFGGSGGGRMAYMMVRSSAHLIAGIASYAGTSTWDFTRYAPSEPVNILHIHGTADPSYWGGSFGVGTFGGLQLASVTQAISICAQRNGASVPVTDAAPTLDLANELAGRDTVITRFTTAPLGGAVELWTVNGAGHVLSFSSEFAARFVDWLLAHPKP